MKPQGAVKRTRAAVTKKVVVEKIPGDLLVGAGAVAEAEPPAKAPAAAPGGAGTRGTSPGRCRGWRLMSAGR